MKRIMEIGLDELGSICQYHCLQNATVIMYSFLR